MTFLAKKEAEKMIYLAQDFKEDKLNTGDDFFVDYT